MSTPGQAATTPRVTRNDETHEYEIRIGDDVAGIAGYHDQPGRILFTHTEIDPAFGGQGLGSVLAHAALDDAVSRGLTIVPYCPFIQAYLRKHPDFAGTVDWPEATPPRAD
ncbi:N-acetyltransferase [Plantibacter flavus]|uniref:GNAT family N-acetyltransferase n=1 Tax=Plantibacter flavus TaxID=150123 RepID=UPI003F1366D1